MSRAGASSSTIMMWGLWLMSGCCVCRQCNGESRTLSGSRTVGGDLAAMHIDDTLYDGKPQPCRTLAGGRLRREPLKPAEQPSEVLRRQPRALIRDPDDRVVVVMRHQQRYLAADRAVFDG